MLKTCPLFILAVCSVILLNSCTKKGSTGATGTAGPPGPAATYKGVINGHVSVYDQYGSKLFNGLGNIQVTLGGVATVSTDATGYFAFTNVSTGTYQITASGTGFATAQIKNVQFSMDTLYTDVKLSTVPAYNLNSFHAYHNPGSAYDSLVLTFAADTRARNCIIFVNKAAPAGNTPGNYLLTYIKPLPLTGWATTSLLVKVPATDLNYANIFYGDKVYYSAASYVVNDASAYEDENTGQMVYNAIGNMLVDSTTSP